MEVHISKLGEAWETAFASTRTTTMMTMTRMVEDTLRSAINMK